MLKMAIRNTMTRSSRWRNILSQPFLQFDLWPTIISRVSSSSKCWDISVWKSTSSQNHHFDYNCEYFVFLLSWIMTFAVCTGKTGVQAHNPIAPWNSIMTQKIGVKYLQWVWEYGCMQLMERILCLYRWYNGSYVWTFSNVMNNRHQYCSWYKGIDENTETCTSHSKGIP